MKFGACDENCLTDFPSLLFLNKARVGKSLISAVSHISSRSSQSTVKITTSTKTKNQWMNTIRIEMSKLTIINRYRRGLETFPQAKTSKSGHAFFLSFFRRVRATSMTQRRVENTRVHFWTFSPVSVKINFLKISSDSFKPYFWARLFMCLWWKV